MNQDNKVIIKSAAESSWTRNEDKLFEAALLDFPEDIDGRWQKIADAVPGKTAEEARVHYEELLHDLEDIEAGRVPLPIYPEDYENVSWESQLRRGRTSFGVEKGSTHGEGESKKKTGTPWTEQEHRKFLEGLEKYGKGDWRSISRNSVITRTPTQVACYAQKYFHPVSLMKKDDKKSSNHDITTTDTNMVLPPPPPPTNTYDGQGAGGVPPPPPQMG